MILLYFEYIVGFASYLTKSKSQLANTHYTILFTSMLVALIADPRRSNFFHWKEQSEVL